MNKLNLHKALAAGIFAATIITITACGNSFIGGGSSSGSNSGGGSGIGAITGPASIKISTIAGGGNSATTTEATQAALGSLKSIVAKGNSLLFSSSRGGSVKIQTLDLATNNLSNKAHTGLGTTEYMEHLLAASASKYYFLTFKSVSSKKAYAIYEASSDLAAARISGDNNVVNAGISDRTTGAYAVLGNPSSQAVIYNDGTNDLLYFIDTGRIRKVTLSEGYSTLTVDTILEFEAWRIALTGDKLIITNFGNSLIFEHDLKTGHEKIIAGGLKNTDGSYKAGYQNAENPLQALLKYPLSIATSPSGNIYFTVQGVASGSQKIIRKLAVNNGVYGAVSTVFGAAPDSTADSVEIENATDIKFVGNNLFVIDEGADDKARIKKIEFINQTP